MLKVSCRRVVLIMTLSLMPAAHAAAYTTMGDVISVEPNTPDNYSVEFKCQAGKVRLGFPTEDIVRVHMAPAGRDFPEDTLHPGQNGPYAVVRYDWPGAKYSITEEFDAAVGGDVYIVRAGSMVVKVQKQPFRLSFHDTAGKLLARERKGLGHENSKVFETMDLPSDEHFFGFGAHNHPHDMRGEKMVCSASELQSAARSGGFPVPFFMSTKGYGVFFNNLDDDVTFNMGTVPGEYSFSGTSGQMEGWDMDYYFIHGPKFEEILDRYTDIAGGPILPEKYFFGHIFNECCSWKASDVEYMARRFRREDWPCDALIIDCQAYVRIESKPAKPEDWDSDTVRPDSQEAGRPAANYQWAESFGDTEQMFKTIKPLGYKPILSSGVQGPLYDWVAYDPTVPEKCEKLAKTFLPRNLDGIESWRQDNSEQYHKHTGKMRLANGYETHNLFGSLWAKNAVEALETIGLYGRPVISRGGPVGGHRYIIPWPGDLEHGLEFLPVDLNWIRNGSMSAYAFTTVNMGGWGGGHGMEEQNLIRRAINMIPFIPISQLVGWGKTGENAMLPWDMTPEQQELLRYYLKFRYRLHPYLYSAAIEASRTGRPLLGPLVLDYQDDPNTYSLGYQFMLGRQILVAPVLEKTEKWEVYLPEGQWIHYWTDKQYDGGRTVTVPAPLYGKDGLPMFVKAGTVIPMMPEMSYIYEKAPDPITLEIYPRQGCSKSVMYDCDTVKSPIRETVFECVQDAEKIEISVTGLKAACRLSVHCRRPASVTVDSTVLEKLDDKCAYDKADAGWYYGAGCFHGSDEIETLNVKVPGRSESHRISITELTAPAKDWDNVDADYKHASQEAYERWRDLKYGLRIHWGYYSLLGIEASWPVRDMSNEEKQHYFDLCKKFNPVNFDAENWMDLFERCGLKYFTITAKHHDGFSLFDTAARVNRRVNYTASGGPAIEDCDLAYSIMDAPIKRDLVAELCDAAHKRGIAIDLYFSHIDWFDADMRFDKWNPFLDKNYNQQTDPEGYARFVKRHRRQIMELLTKYGKIDMMCLDMHLPEFCWPDVKETIKMARKIQPDVLFRRRGIGAYGDYQTPENWIPDGPGQSDKRVVKPWMVIYTLAGQFAYEGDGQKYKSGEWIVSNLIDIVAKGGNFMVSIGPDGDGNFHPAAVEKLQYTGDWLKVNGRAIYGTRPWKHYKEGEDVRFTRSKDNRYIYAIALKFPGRQFRSRLLKPKQGSEIMLLGDKSLNWRMDDDTELVVEIPDRLQDPKNRPCRQAFVFRIEPEE